MEKIWKKTGRRKMMKTYQIQMEISGSSAIWTRPDTGDGFVSYPAPTFSAVKGIFESILWGPVTEVVPTKVEICAPIQYHVYNTNYGGPLRRDRNIKNETVYQMTATVLVDVCYRLYAEVIVSKDKANLPQSALDWDNATTCPEHAYQAIFNRRLKRGQCYSVPCLGWKEFTASYFGEFRDGTVVEEHLPTITIPSMLRQVFSKGRNFGVSYLFDTGVKIEKGVLLFNKGVKTC